MRNPQEKAAVKKVIEKVIKVKIYSTPKLVPHLAGEDNINFNKVIWAPFMRRLYSLSSN
jgi:midasin (ATPase involved in ribosome maturation)